MQPSFELFDHTADMGLRIRAPDLPALCRSATQALYAAIGSLHTSDGPATAYPINLAADGPALLLRDWLTEMLVLFECDGKMAASMEVPTFDERHLIGTAHLVDVDLPRSDLYREVKAVTYHELAVRTVAGGFEATMIIDI